MRNILLICCILFTFSVGAATNDSLACKIRLGASYQFGIPQRAFAWQSNNRFISGQCMPTSGMQLYLTYCLSRFTLGIEISAINYRLKKDKVDEWLKQRYHKIGYFTNIEVNHYYFDIGAAALTCSYTCPIKVLELEPFVQIGIGAASQGYFNNTYYVERKKMNDNYSEHIAPVMTAKPFFFPGIGLKLNKKLWRGIYGTAGVQYNTGKLVYTLQERITDFMNKTTIVSESVTQPVNTLVIQGGVQIRITKKIISDNI